MKAVLFDEHGDIDNLYMGEIEAPAPGPGQVQVAIRAAALNHLDLFVLRGWPGLELEMPHIPGADGAGVVSAIGEGVTQFAAGDRVVIDGTLSCGACEFCLAGRDNLCVHGGILAEDARGTFAETIVLPERNLLKLPDTISFEEAAAASLVFLTAYHSLITRGGVKPGETVLVVGAGGGVNTAAIQIAHLIGATVYVVGSTDEKLARARELGADVLINRHEEPDWGRAVQRLTGKRGVDAVVDNVGEPTWPMSLRALARGGRLLVVGGTGGFDTRAPVNYVFKRHLSIIGSTMAPQADFRTVMGLMFAGKLHPVIDRVRPLDEAAEAFRQLERGDMFGKIVLTL